MVKNLPASLGDIRDMGSVPRQGRFPGGGHGDPLQYCCLKNPMDRGTWQAIVHRVSKSQTQLKRLSTDACMQAIIMIFWNDRLKKPECCISHKYSLNAHYFIFCQTDANSVYMLYTSCRFHDNLKLCFTANCHSLISSSSLSSALR